MRKVNLLLIGLLIGMLTLGGTAIATDSNYLLAKKDKVHKVKKEKKVKKGPNQNALDHANKNAKFKRYEDYSPKDKEKLDKKKWDEMSTEEKGTISEKYKKNKEKIDDLKRNVKSLGDIK